MKSSERIQVAQRISTVSIGANVLLSVVKIFIGIIGRSSALVADGFHSVSDVATTVMAMVGVRIAGRQDDDDHPYGHEKIEAVVGKLMATILFITGAWIAYNAYSHLAAGDVVIPDRIAIYAALLSIGVKEAMYHYTMAGANKIESAVLKADAWHHRLDAISSVGSFIGILGAIMGLPILDPIASILIGGLIMKVAVDIYYESVRQLIDTAASPDTLEDIQATIMATKGVLAVDDLKTRIHVNRLFVDVEIAVDGNLALWDAHEIAEDVHDNIEAQIPSVKHCMVHVNPVEPEA